MKLNLKESSAMEYTKTAIGDCYSYLSAQKFILIIPFLLLSLISSVAYSENSNALNLTVEELKLLEKYPVIRMGIGTAFPPFQYVTKESGQYKFRGIASDTAKLIEEKLGVTLEPVFGISFKEALVQGKLRKIDLFPAVANTPERREFLNFTEPYTSYPLVIISRDDSPFIGSINDLKNQRVATIKHLANYSKLSNEYSSLGIHYHFEKDVKSVLTAVSLDEADYAISNLAVASYLINSLGLTNLKVAAPTPWKYNKLSMGVRSDEPLLKIIIQKALDSITVEEKQSVAQKWISIKYDELFDPWTIRYVVFPTGLFILFTVAIILWRNSALKKEIGRREIVEEKLYHAASHDPLTGLTNRRLFVDLLNQGIKYSERTNQQLAVVFIDLDDFKQINDNCGHIEGDKVLQKIANRIVDSVRKADVVARFGGDEFVLLLNDVKSQSATRQMLQNLTSKISNPIKIGKNNHVLKLSIGIAIYPKDGDNIDLLLNNADSSMYISKSSADHSYTFFGDTEEHCDQN